MAAFYQPEASGTAPFRDGTEVEGALERAFQATGFAGMSAAAAVDPGLLLPPGR